MQKKLLTECLRIARQHLLNGNHPESRYPHYTFIIQDNAVVEWATNKGGNVDYLLKKGYPSHSKLHAEPEAWRKAKGLLRRGDSFEILNIRLNKTGELRQSKPCKCCHDFMQNLGCTKFYHSTDFGFTKTI